VLVVDDHRIVREGISHILASQADIQVVGEAADGNEALAKARELKPDVVLMDISMPGLSGREATRLIKQQLPEIHLLALTMHDSYDYFLEMLRAGADGYILKGASGADLVAAIRAANGGGVYLYPSVAKKLMSDYLGRITTEEEQAGFDGLTDRERDVLRLIAAGKTNQEIADILSVSPNTVHTHRTHIMEKLDLHNRAGLVRYAVRKGLIANGE
jgi:two-component system response regulator NreC